MANVCANSMAYVIPDPKPPATLQGAATWRIVTIPELRVTLQGAATWRIQ